MNDDLLKISLNHGKQFNIYQTKIKKNISKSNKIKEGFVTNDNSIPIFKNIQLNTSLTNDANQRDLTELKELQIKYANLIQQYKDNQKKIEKSSLYAINRVSSNNPYLGKNIRFTNGTICYVTNEGIVRPYPNMDVYKNTVGKNGCPPKGYIQLDLSWSSDYIKGALIPTKPSLIVGSNMTIGESCGNEGLNVYASTLINNPNSNYIGCYNDTSRDENTNDDRAMIYNPDIISYTSFDKCKEYAVNNGYQYFGLQDVQSDGNAACLASNDINRIKMYGDGSIQTNLIPIWSSNTVGSGASSCYVNMDGKLIISDANGNILWESPNSPGDCWLGGRINPDSLIATYGGNCNNKVSVSSGNVTDTVKKLLDQTNPKDQLMITVNNEIFGDPAKGCSKSWDTAYQCGNTWKNSHIDYAEGQNFLYDCSEESKNCVFYFMLQTDGNLCLYRGVDPSNNKGNIWCTNTNGKQKSSNPEWVASKGKFGRPYLKLNESLNQNEWIGSEDGSLKLILQTDGNLVLYTSEIKQGCKVINGKTYGVGLVNSVYELSGMGNKSTLGKIGYIDSESKLREYPGSMVGFTNDYQIYQNTDSTGNDITNIITPDENGCQSACNNNPDCAAYVYQGISQTCWLKNKSSYPNGEKQMNSNTVLGVRQHGLKNSTNCSNNKIVNIDTIQYDNYVKGQVMSTDSQCKSNIVSQVDKLKNDNIKSQLTMIGNDIILKMENLYNEDKDIFKKLNMTNEEFKKDLENYKLTNFKIKRELEMQKLNSDNIEGMQNLNMNDLQGMLSDSDLRVLQGNYSYIMWSILAVGILTITINTLKK